MEIVLHFNMKQRLTHEFLRALRCV